jgi:drug/metabolite transporter (DMT)-like permease
MVTGARENRPLLLLRALCGGVTMGLCYFSVTHLPLADATTLIFTSPLHALWLGRLVLREEFLLFHGVMCTVMLGAVALILRPPFLFGGGGSAGASVAAGGGRAHAHEEAFLDGSGVPRWVAVGAGLLGGVGSAGTSIIVRLCSKRGEPVLAILHALGAGGMVVGAAVAALTGEATARGRPWPPRAAAGSGNSDLELWLVVAGVCLCALGGQVCRTLGLQREKAGPAVMMRFLDVPFAFLYSLLLLDETVPLSSVLGAATVLLCCALVVRHKLQRQMAGDEVSAINTAPSSSSSPLSSSPSSEGGSGSVELSIVSKTALKATA